MKTTSAHKIAEPLSLMGIATRLFDSSRLIPLPFPAAILVSALALLGIQGCEKVSQGVVDPKGVPAFLSEALVKPDSLKLTTLPQSNGILTVNIQVRIRVAQPAGSAGLSSVGFNLFSTSATEPFLQGTLSDNGVAPDSAAGDGIYSAALQFGIPRSSSGRFRLQFTAKTNDGLVSNLVEKSLYMIRNNKAPVLSNLQAPDTVTVPAGGKDTLTIGVRTVDPDGQGDIRQVYFQSLDSSNPNFKIILRDDGDINGPSGDVTAGDSVYTINIRLDNPVHKTYRFAFQAVDAFGDTSATLLHRLTIQ